MRAMLPSALLLPRCLVCMRTWMSESVAVVGVVVANEKAKVKRLDRNERSASRTSRPWIQRFSLDSER